MKKDGEGSIRETMEAYTRFGSSTNYPISILEMLFDRLPAGMAVFDRNLRLCRFNLTWAELIDRYTPHCSGDVVIGAHWFDLIPGNEDVVLPLLERAMAGEPVFREGLRSDREGLPSYWDMVFAPIIEDDQVGGIINLISNATDRVNSSQELTKTVEALRENEINLRSLLTNAKNFVVYRAAVDSVNPLGGRILMVSPSITEIVGIRDPYDFACWFENIHADDYARIVEANRQAWEKGTDYNQVVRVYHPQKERWIWLHTISTPVFDEYERLTHFNGLILDISNQKEAEEALQRQLSFESLITALSTQFINLAPDEIDAGIRRALQALGEATGVDRAYVFLMAEDGTTIRNTHSWTRLGAPSLPHEGQVLPVAALEWSIAQLQKLQTILVLNTSEEIAPEAWLGQPVFGPAGGGSRILIPMAHRGGALGFVGFDTLQETHTWTDGQISLLKIVSEIFVNTLERKRVEEALRESQVMLEQRVEERTRELTTLLDVSWHLASTLELQPRLDLILDQLSAVVPYQGASIFELDGSILRVVAYRGPIPREKALKIEFPIEAAGANQVVIENRQPLVIADVHGGSPMAQAFRKTAGVELERSFRYVRSWLGVPMVVKNQVIGMLSLDHPQPGYYQEDPHARLAQAFASQVGVAIENARLYFETRQRADEAHTLFAVQQAISSRLDPDAVLQMIADEARRLTNSRQGAVYLLDQNEFVIAVISGEVSPNMLGYRLPVEGSVAGLSIQTGKPILVRDAQNDARVHVDVVQQVGAESFIIVPLISSTGPVGTITVANKQAGALTAQDERVLTMLASSAVIGLENAHLYREEQARRQESERRRQVAEGLREILAVLNSNKPLNEVLNFIVAQSCQLLEATSTTIRHSDLSANTVTAEASYNLPPDFDAVSVTRLYYSKGDRMLMDRQPVCTPDLRANLKPALSILDELDDVVRAWVLAQYKHYRSALAVPIFVKDELYGAMIFFFALCRDFSEEDIRLAMNLGDHAALAIENARLRSQVEKSAVAAERSRLARDLHDAVTQTLFSASLIAEVLPRLWERNPEEGRRRLDELRQLTRGALAEMRTLLLELRPSALVEADIGELFRHLVEAFTGRARVPVRLKVEGKAPLPAEVKVALYRITQEALNNIAKHAEPSVVYVDLDCSNDVVELRIRDDGQGFDIDAVGPEHLGLGIMRERARNIKAEISIASRVGEGTQILVNWRKS